MNVIVSAVLVVLGVLVSAFALQWDSQPNPLDLHGGPFLLFYAGFSAAAIGAAAFIRERLESGTPGKVDLGDAFLVAYLRGGARAVAETATVGLVARGLLEITDMTELRRTRVDAEAFVETDVERGLLGLFNPRARPNQIVTSQALGGVCGPYRTRLEEAGALPGGRQRAVRGVLLLTLLGVLAGVALLKIVVALSRGRHNVQLLFLLAFVAVIVAFASSVKTRTAQGDSLLDDARELYAGLRVRLRRLDRETPGPQVALLVGAYGVKVLAGTSLAFMAPMLAPPPSDSGGDSSGGGSSCSSGCGGGGGCGGCGS